MALSFVFVRDEGFPGWIAALPVAGSTLALAGIGTSSAVLQRWLAHPAMVFVGKRSYSLYLWHWPAFSFVDYRFFLADAAFRLALKIVVTILATLLTYHFVERRMRPLAERPATPQCRIRRVGRGSDRARRDAIRSNYYFNAEPSSRHRRHNGQSGGTRMGRADRRQPRLDVRICVGVARA